MYTIRLKPLSKTITNSAFVLRKHIIIGHNYTSRKFVLKMCSFMQTNI